MCDELGRERLEETGIHQVVLETAQDDGFDGVGSDIEAVVTRPLVAGCRAPEQILTDLGVVAVADAALQETREEVSGPGLFPEGFVGIDVWTGVSCYR